MPVELRKGGLQLSGSPLSLDATRKSPLSFVSHAHSDHIARHERVIATAATLRLMAHRLGKLNAPLPAPYHRPFELGALLLELFPAGHVLGSAQLRVTREDGLRVLYSGDLNLTPSLTAEPAYVPECDVLVLESTFGHPRFAFPPRDEVLADIEAWVRRQLAAGVHPILMAYALGRAQEIIKYLGDRGLALRAHPSIHSVSQVYRELGVDLRVSRFEGVLTPGEVGVFPPFGRSAALRQLTPRATAVLTGWALDPSAVRRYGADVAFPLSDHADFAGLVRFARQTGASEVITHHGFARELAAGLRRDGLCARPVGAPLQLDLFGAR